MTIASMIAAPQAWLAANGIRLAAYAIGALVLVAAGAAGGFWLADTMATAKLARKDVEIAGLKQKDAEGRAAGATAALEDLTRASAAIAEAAKRYSGIQINLSSQIAQIREDLKNAKPLPADCRPDNFRVLKLSTALGAARKAAAGQ